MSAVLAPVFTPKEASSSYYWERAGNHPAVRASRLRSLRGVGVSAAKPRLPWELFALRAGAFVLAALLAVLAGMMLGIVLDPATFAQPSDYFSYTVASGDSLWSIASTYAAGLPTSEVMARIMDINGVDASTILTSGQHLLVPLP